MRKLLAGVSLAVMMAVSDAGAVTVTCTNCATAWGQVKDSAVLAKQYALEVKGWLDVANTYTIAAQNTLQLAPAAIAQAQGLYYRTAALGTATEALVGPNGSIMQRVNMLNSLGRGAGGLPSDTINSWEFWNEQRKRQMEENARLLGLEQEREAINQEMAEAAAYNGNAADGQLRALQANNQATVAVSAQLASLNATMQQQFQYQMERDAVRDAQDRQAQNWLTTRPHEFRPWIGN